MNIFETTPIQILLVSINDVEISDKFILLQNLHLCLQKFVCPSTGPLGEPSCTFVPHFVGGESPLQLSS